MVTPCLLAMVSHAKIISFSLLPFLGRGPGRANGAAGKFSNKLVGVDLHAATCAPLASTSLQGTAAAARFLSAKIASMSAASASVRLANSRSRARFESVPPFCLGKAETGDRAGRRSQHEF